MSSAAVGAGFILAGRYRLVEPLASGGMGTVWRAVDVLLDRPVAIKEVRLPPGLDADARQQLRRRTIREAQAAARLRHAATVTIYDVVEHDGRPWIVMELVPSRSLAEIIRIGGPLPPVRVASIGLRVLDAIVAVAAAGIEHRDVKPANVLVTREGRVVLTDFGIARHVGDETLTSAGLIVGSPDYLAPERARGKHAGIAADLWSLGATMYHAVEGRPPFERDGPLPTLAAVVMDEPDPPLRAGPLQPVIDRLLIKDPSHRLDADGTRTMLERVLRGRPAAATMPLPRQPADDAGPTAPVAKPPPAPTTGRPATTGGGPTARTGPTAATGSSATDPTAATGSSGAVNPAGAAGAAAGAAAAGSSATDPAAATGSSGAANRAAGAAAGAAAAGSSATDPAAATGSSGAANRAAGAAAGAAAAGLAAAAGSSAAGSSAATRPAAATGPAAAAATPTTANAPTTADTPTNADTPTTADTPTNADTPTDTGTPTAAAIPTAAYAARPPRTYERETTADRPDGRRRRTAVLVGLVVLVLAGLAAVLVPTLSGGGQNQATGPTGSRAPSAGATAPGAGARAPSAGSTAPSAGSKSTARSSAPTAAPTRTATPPNQTAAAGSRVTPPAGFTRYTDPGDGFSLVIPSGWQPVRRDTRVDFDDPSSSRFLRIDTSDNPLPDPYQNWIDYERQFRQGKADYHLIGIRRVEDYRPEEGWTTADWEFTLGGTHVLDRNIRVSSARAHAIYWSTPQDRWDAADSRRILSLAEQSFVPAPVG